MNRTGLIVGAAVLLGAIVLGQTAENKYSAPQIGRYQLLYGEHELRGANGVSTNVKGIFRIDTVTGQTSFYNNVNPIPAIHEPLRNEWFPITEFKP